MAMDKTNVTDVKDDTLREKSKKSETKISSKRVSIKDNDDDDVTFNFFYDLVKKLILKRKNVGDVCTLSSWLKALEQKTNSSIRNDYIKLMILALQHNEPMCPFKDPPPEIIDPLANEMWEMARKFARGEGTATCVGRNEETSVNPKYPSISTAVSRDKCRYAACQVIPNVGVQCYYAYSDDHMYNWNLPPQISLPREGPHARDIDWERATAGVNPETKKPAVEESPDARKRSGTKKDDETVSISNSGSTKTTNTKRKERARENEDSILCNVMNIEQQNRNVKEEFGWNDASLLTGTMILGAEMISDCKITSQLKTQVEIDEEVVSCHDKLYPGDFRIIVDPAATDGIIIPEKKYVTMQEAGDKSNSEYKTPQFDEKPAKKSQLDGQRSKAGLPPVRQRAGQETVKSPQGEDHRGGAAKDYESQKHRISKLSADLAALKTTNGPGGRCEDRERAVEPAAGKTCPSKAAGAPVAVNGSPRDGKSLFERASMEMHRRLNAVSELFVDESKVFTSKRP